MTDRPHTLGETLVSTASDGRGVLEIHLDEGTERITAPELVERATARARHLLELGLRPGDRLGLLGPSRAAWAEWAYATWVAGGALVPLQHPLRIRDPAAFADQVARVVSVAGCRIVAAEPALLPAVPAGLGIAWDEPSEGRAAPTGAHPDDVAIIQFTSGSTAAPKGVVLTHRQILAERAGYVAARGMDERDRLFSWMPLFHDWGIFNYLIVPMSFGIEGHLLPVERFARDPAEWLRGLTEFGATVTGGPPSAWAAAMQAAQRDPGGIDLHRIRSATISAESLDAQAVERLVTQAGSLGLRPDAFSAAYGMAEATLAVTSAEPMTGLRWDEVDLEQLVRDGRAVPPSRGKRSRRIASCGSPTGEYEVMIGGPSGTVPERCVGEILVRGPGVMSGYLGDGVPDPFLDGWLRTGDLGYLVDGELYVTGRIKDVVIVFGQNYYPEDFEWAASRVHGVRAGRCVAFGHPADEAGVVVVVEPAPGFDPGTLGAAVRQAVSDAVGIVVAEVLVVAPGTVRKTTSGKLQRGAMREAFARSELVALGAIARTP